MSGQKSMCNGFTKIKIIDELTTEDLQYNITYYLTSSPSDEVNRIFKETLV